MNTKFSLKICSLYHEQWGKLRDILDELSFLIILTLETRTNLQVKIKNYVWFGQNNDDGELAVCKHVKGEKLFRAGEGL